MLARGLARVIADDGSWTSSVIRSIDRHLLHDSCIDNFNPPKVVDVTKAFWGGRPANWKDITFLAAPDSPGGGEKYPKWAHKTFSWGYRAMCDFWSRTVFDVPEVHTAGV